MEEALERLVPSAEDWPGHLHRAIRHSLFAGGKRLRPILCLAAAEEIGSESRPALEPACGLEMIHTYSLIHDDLPALDDDDTRRGQPSCHVAFGEATAILAGDALLTHGLGVLAQYPTEEVFDPVRSRVVAHVAEAIGTRGMIGGQIADLEAEGARAVGEEALRAIHENKTGKLIRAALTVGGMLSFASEDDLALLDSYGQGIGLAFQIKDDLLDVEGDSATLGKKAGKDADAGKVTFPSVWGVDGAHRKLAETIEEAVAAASRLPSGGARLQELARYVADRRS